MADAGCINAYDNNGCFLQTIDTLNSEDVGQDVCYRFPNIGNREVDYVCYKDKCGCSCRIDGENEFIIHATQGVLNAITLTQNSTNSTVNVKWSELFGGNWKKTVVRYKTGGYPVSEVDGTLAVEELTQNQYATNGYNVSGLADATTYYFRAFAVAQDDTVIEVKGGTITTDFFRVKYQKLEYIYSSTYGPQIDTGITPNQNTVMQFKVMPLGTFGGSIIGAYYSGISDTQDHRVFNYQNQIYYDLPGGSGSGNRIYGSTFAANNVYEFEAGDWYVKNVGASSNLISGGAFNFTGITTIRLNDGMGAYCRRYYVKIFDSGTLVRNLRPYKRKSDNTPVMIDKLTRTVYTNSGTGSFLSGPYA